MVWSANQRTRGCFYFQHLPVDISDTSESNPLETCAGHNIVCGRHLLNRDEPALGLYSLTFRDAVVILVFELGQHKARQTVHLP